MSAFPLVVTEGLLEVPVAQKVLTALGIAHEETRFVPKGGNNAFWRDAMKYNHAAQHVAFHELERTRKRYATVTM